jgi:hypothetical protein
MDTASGGDAVSTVAPERNDAAPATTSAPTTTQAPTTTSTLAPTTTTTIIVIEEAVVGGPGVDHSVLMAALAPLVDAENAMHAFEADWDAGMTYSQTFRGWREVKGIVAEAFDGFALPEDASTDQLIAGMDYVDAVQGAHDEWQNVTEFIVTYITNYTPEVFILDAYSQVEFRLRDAIAAREALTDLDA